MEVSLYICDRKECGKVVVGLSGGGVEVER